MATKDVGNNDGSKTSQEDASQELSAEELDKVSGGSGIKIPLQVMDVSGGDPGGSGVGAGGQGVPAAPPAGSSSSQGGGGGRGGADDALSKAADAYQQMLNAVNNLK
jgi:hypothetical protein